MDSNMRNNGNARTERNPTPSTTPRVHRGGEAFRLGLFDPRSQLAVLTLFYALTYSLNMIIGITIAAVEQKRVSQFIASTEFAIAIASIICSMGLFVVAKWRVLSESATLRFASVWVVFGALGIMVIEGWHSLRIDAYMEIGEIPGISWACVFITAYPLLVRTGLGHTLATSLLAAASGPLFVYLYTRHTGTLVELRYLAQFFIPLGISAVVSVFPAFVVGRLHRNLEKVRQLGSYRLEGLLGKGGMGEVWRARHQMLIRPAAIKLIKPQVLSVAESGSTPGSGTIRRFEREVQATALLKSPHTVSVFDFGVTDQGSLYYVMELLDGLNAQSLVSTHGPIGDGRASYLLKQVCHSLAEAHGQGLVHRDIKPANIFVCRQGLDHDFVKVLDFGLVKPTDRSRDVTQLTAEGILTGTPAFIAPEVALGQRNVDHRLDIYAIGCVAYWLVTGATVFEGETPMTVVLKHVQELPIPPRQRTELDIASEFEQVILSCLAKDPRERPQTVIDLTQQLEACTCSVPWSASHALEWWQMHIPAGELQSSVE